MSKCESIIGEQVMEASVKLKGLQFLGQLAGCGGSVIMKREGDEASVKLKGLQFSGQQTGCGGSVTLSANAKALLANK